MNTYMILMQSGQSQELEAEFYETNGLDIVFMAHQGEVLRVPAADVASITKAR